MYGVLRSLLCKALLPNGALHLPEPHAASGGREVAGCVLLDLPPPALVTGCWVLLVFSYAARVGADAAGAAGAGAVNACACVLSLYTKLLDRAPLRPPPPPLCAADCSSALSSLSAVVTVINFAVVVVVSDFRRRRRRHRRCHPQRRTGEGVGRRRQKRKREGEREAGAE